MPKTAFPRGGGLFFPAPLLLAPSTTQPPAHGPPTTQTPEIPSPRQEPLCPFLSLCRAAGLQVGKLTFSTTPNPEKRGFREGQRSPCPFLGHLEYLLCPGGLGWDLWHVPGAVAPHLPQCPWLFPFFCPQRLRGAQSCGLMAASPGTVTSPQYAHPARRLSSSFGTS